MIISLANVAKELLENALDAEATRVGKNNNNSCAGEKHESVHNAKKRFHSNNNIITINTIEIRLKNYGFELIEVVDNGEGMSEADMERVGLPHHTSKLRRFEDLENLKSLGFRGEALASLVALSEVSISSKPKSSSTIDQKDIPAITVDLDQHGNVRARHSIAREVTRHSFDHTQFNE